MMKVDLSSDVQPLLLTLGNARIDLDSTVFDEQQLIRRSNDVRWTPQRH